MTRLLSSFAFKFEVCRYIKEAKVRADKAERAAAAATRAEVR
jgi:hypothetical protein